MGPGPRFIQAGATRAEADAMDLPALVLRVGPSASLKLLSPVPTNRWIEARVSTAGQPPVLRHYSGPTTRDSRPRAAYVKGGALPAGTLCWRLRQSHPQRLARRHRHPTVAVVVQVYYLVIGVEGWVMPDGEV